MVFKVNLSEIDLRFHQKLYDIQNSTDIDTITASTLLGLTLLGSCMMLPGFLSLAEAMVEASLGLNALPDGSMPILLINQLCENTSHSLEGTLNILNSNWAVSLRDVNMVDSFIGESHINVANNLSDIGVSAPDRTVEVSDMDLKKISPSSSLNIKPLLFGLAAVGVTAGIFYIFRDNPSTGAAIIDAASK